MADTTPAPTFEASFHALVGRELQFSRRDPERAATLIQLLASSLGKAAAICTRGDEAGIQELLTGAEALAMEKAIELAPMMRALAQMMEKPDDR